MTMQMPDTFSYKGVIAEAIAISKPFSFTPKKSFGIETVAWGTAYYRGFWCDYSINESLIIKNLSLFAKNHVYPLINGKEAIEIPLFSDLFESIKEKRKPNHYMDYCPMQYVGIDYEYDYSGKIVLGLSPKYDKPIRKRYENVIELLFDVGHVEERKDITEIWNATNDCQENEYPQFWWQDEKNSYFYLLNYRFMGLDNSKSEGNSS